MATSALAKRAPAPCTRENASRSIKGFKLNHPDGLQSFLFDDTDPDQITEYMQLRKAKLRIAPADLVNVMKRKKTSLDSTAGMKETFWCVPKENLPGDIADDIKAAMLSDEEIREYECLSGGNTCDLDKNYIIDCMIDRTRLGRKVSELEFSTKRSTRRKMTPPGGQSEGGGGITITLLDRSGRRGAGAIEDQEAGDDSGASNPLDRPGENKAKKEGEVDDEAKTKAASNPLDRGLKRTGSNASDANDPKGLDRPAKHAKTLLSTMSALKASILSAMDKNLWTGEGPLQTNNVKNLLHELRLVLVDMKGNGDLQTAQSASLTEKILTWYASACLTRRCFCYMKGMGGTLSQLVEEVGGRGNITSSGAEMILILEAMARVEIEDDSTLPDLMSVSVSTRTLFRDSELWSSFVEAKVDSNLTKAKAASGSERFQILKGCSDVPGILAGTQSTVQDLITLLDENMPLKARIIFMVRDKELAEQVLKLAKDWDPDGVVGVAAQMLGERADLSGRSYFVFEKVAEAIIGTAG